jgi:hypothetical protein
MNTEVASNSSEVAGNSSVVASNSSEVAGNSSEVASNSKEVASNSSEVDEIQIDHFDTNDLIKKSNLLFDQMKSDTVIVIKSLNSYKRQLLHNICIERQLFHWSVKIDDKNKNFFVSNKKSDEAKYLMAMKYYQTRDKTVEMRVNEIDFNLSRLDLNNIRRTALEYEKSSILIPKTSNEANEAVGKILTDSTQSNRGRGRGRGRIRGCTILAGTGRGSEENENVRSPYALRSKRN